MSKKEMKLEPAMARIEEIITLLEEGEKPLEESMQLFQEATLLASQCSKMLEDAQLTIEEWDQKTDE